jgi:peptide/nickel transport system permease protein
MFQYVLKRLLVMIPTLLGITLITFFIIDAAPGDPVALSMGVSSAGTSGEGGGGSQEKASLAIKAKKQLLGILSKDHVVRLWDAAAAALPNPADTVTLPALPLTGRSEKLGDWPHALVVSPDGTLYTGTEAGDVFALDPQTGALLRTFAVEDLRTREGGKGAGVWALAVSPDGTTLAAGDTDGRLLLWSAADGRRVAAAPALGKPLRDIVFKDGGKSLVTACDDGRIRVHDVADGHVVSEIREHTGGVLALAVSPDGSTLWSGGFDRRLREWNAATKQLRRVVSVHGQAITDIAVSRDGRRVATSCDDRKLRVFDATAADGAEPVTCVGHYKEATAVVFSADGRFVWGGAKDETIRSFDAETGVPTCQTPESTGKVYALAVSQDGTHVFSASESWTKTPVWGRYLKWLKATVTFDFGTSFTDERRVIDKIKEALPITLGLNVVSILLIYLVSVPLGVRAAVRRGGAFDTSSSVVLFLLASMPSFWVGTMLMLGLSSERHVNVLPSVGLHGTDAESMSYLPWLWDWGRHLVLPIVVLTYAGFAGLSRYVRTSMLDTISQDYIRTARAKGLAERVVMYRHALRNSLITVVTLLGTLLPAMIGGSVIVEFMFTIPGMGWLGFEAIQARDYPVVMAITTFSALLTMVGMLVSDLLYGLVDPRISHA